MPIWLLIGGIAILIKEAACGGGEPPVTGDDDTSSDDATGDDDDTAPTNPYNIGKISLSSFCSSTDPVQFLIRDDTIHGFCGLDYFQATANVEDLEDARASSLFTFPEDLGGRELLPRRIRKAPEGRLLFTLTTQDIQNDTKATYVLFNPEGPNFLHHPIINAQDLQVEAALPEDRVWEEGIPLNGATDAGIFSSGEASAALFIMSNPNRDETFRDGVGVIVPVNGDGELEPGLPAEEDEIHSFLSDRVSLFTGDRGNHFSFETTTKRPCAVADLGDGKAAVLNCGVAEDGEALASAGQAGSVDVVELANGNVTQSLLLGTHLMADIASVAVNTDDQKLYAAVEGEPTVLEIDLGAETFAEIELTTAQVGDKIAALALKGGKLYVGGANGTVAVLEEDGDSWSVRRQDDFGSDLTDLKFSGDNLFVSVVSESEGRSFRQIKVVDPEQIPAVE